MNKSKYLIYLFVNIIIGLSVINISLAGNGEKTRIAILDFEVKSKKVDQDAGAILADAFGYRLHRLNCFDVINRDEMKKVLKEHEVTCTFIGCAEVLSDMLDVQKLITGSIGKLGDTFSLTVSLIDIATTKEEYSEYESVKGKIDSLIEIAGNMAVYFCGDIKPEKSSEPEQEFPLPDGFVSVKDSPIDESTGFPVEIKCVKDGSILILVPEGEFTMGSKYKKNEGPVRRIYLDRFYIDKHETTVSQFRKFCKVTGHNMWKQPDWSGDNHPVVYVRYKDAVAYCKWAGKRLPTEAEWEKAARGPDGNVFPWGKTNVTGLKANFCDVNCEKKWNASFTDDSFANTAPIGSYEKGKSPYGCYDMAGNVSEWCADWYKKDYYRNSGVKNPTGPSSGKYRVHRGGSCYHKVDEIRSSYRNYSLPLEIKPGRLIGFRGAVSP